MQCSAGGWCWWWRLEVVPGALIISTHHHTLSLGRDDSHLPTQTMQLLAAGSRDTLLLSQCSALWALLGISLEHFNTEN